VSAFQAFLWGMTLIQFKNRPGCNWRCSACGKVLNDSSREALPYCCGRVMQEGETPPDEAGLEGALRADLVAVQNPTIVVPGWLEQFEVWSFRGAPGGDLAGKERIGLLGRTQRGWKVLMAPGLRQPAVSLYSRKCDAVQAMLEVMDS